MIPFGKFIDPAEFYNLAPIAAASFAIFATRNKKI